MMVKGIQSEAMVNMGSTGGKLPHRAGRDASVNRTGVMTGLRLSRNRSSSLRSAAAVDDVGLRMVCIAGRRSSYAPSATTM